MSTTSAAYAAPATADVPQSALPWTGLFRAELRRLRLRRLLVLAVAASFAILLVALALVYFSHSQDAGVAAAQAEQEHARTLASCERERPLMEARLPPGETLPPCSEMVPSAEQLREFNDPRFRVVTMLPQMLSGATFGFAVLAFALGASAVGAEWSARTLPALLFWEPRRMRVLLTKLAALLLGVGLISTLGLALVLGGGLLAGRQRGTFEGVSAVPGGFWAPLLQQAGRGVLLAAVTAAVAFAVASMLRHTAAALGVAFAYFAIGEPAIQVLRPAWQPWLFGPNAAGWLERDGYRTQVLRAGAERDGSVDETDYVDLVITHLEGGRYLLIVTALLLVAALAIFRRRDLT